jgi:branched-chain amino acid transport system substrate-binding protein
MKKPICATLALLASFWADFAPAAHAQTTYDIPTILSLTGSGAFLGKQQQQTVKLVEELVNKSGGVHGKPVRFVVHDDQSSPQVSVQVTSALIAEQPALMLGSSLVSSCSAMAPLVSSGPVLYCLSPVIAPPAGSFVFAPSASTHFQAETLLRFFRAKGWKRIALITSTDATGQDGDRDFAKLFASPDYSDLTLTTSVHFNIGDVAIAAQMENVRASAPQAVIFWVSGTPAATVFRGLKQAAVELPIGTIGSNMTYAQMTEYAAFLPKDLYLPNPEWPAAGETRFGIDPQVAAQQTQLYASYQQAGIKVDAASVGAWDPAMILVSALRHLPPNPNAEQVRAEIAHAQSEPGVQGLYDFTKQPQRGIGLDSVLVTRWNAAAGKWDVVSRPGGQPLE